VDHPEHVKVCLRELLYTSRHTTSGRKKESDKDMLRKSLLALMLLPAAMCAHADENSGFEPSLGASRTDYDLSRDVTGGLRFTDHTLGYSGFIGYRFMPQLAVEAHYFHGGTATWGGGNARLDLDSKAYGASVMGHAAPAPELRNLRPRGLSSRPGRAHLFV